MIKILFYHLHYFNSNLLLPESGFRPLRIQEENGSCSGPEMAFRIDAEGMLSMKAAGRVEISPSPLGLVSIADTLYAPVSARIKSDIVTLEFIMSRTVAYKAGLLLSYTLEESPKADSYLSMVKMESGTSSYQPWGNYGSSPMIKTTT